MSETKNNQEEFNFKNFFIPLTTGKVIFWIIIIGFFVFSNGLFNGLVGDDELQIAGNLLIRSIGNVVTFFTGSTFYNGGIPQGAGVYYKPILSTYYSLIYTFFGLNTFTFHFFQLVLHVVNACIVFLIFKKFFKILPSFFLALIFLVHPMNSEAVFYTSAAQEPLFFFFGSLALLYLGKIKSNKELVIATVLLFLSLLSKETGILFIAVSILYVYIYSRKYLAKLLVCSSGIVVLYSLLRFHAIKALDKPTCSPIDYMNFWERMINVPTMFLFYVRQFIFPLNLSMSYQWAYKQITINNFLMPLVIDIVVVILLIGGAFLLKRRGFKSEFKTCTFFLFWFFLGIAIHMQIFPLDAVMADRWLYFPIVGILGMIGVFLSVIKLRINKIVITVIIFLIVSLFAFRTFIRSFNWRSNFSITTKDVEVSKNAYDLQNALGYHLLKQGKTEEAKDHVERSIELFPYMTNYINLGVIYVYLGEYEKAKEAYENALKFGDYYLVYDNLAGLGLAHGNPKENIKFINGAIKKFPQDANLWKYLAIMEYVYGDKENGKAAIIKAYQYNPNDQYIVSIYNTIMNNQPIKLNFSKKVINGASYYTD